MADDAAALADACDDARAVVGKILPPPNLAAAVSAAFADAEDDTGHHHRATATGRVVVRASCDADDLARTRGSGLRVSVVGARARSSREVAEAVRDAWTSAYAPDAVRDRVAAGRSMTNARVAVMVQAMLPAEVSFVAHTGGPAAASGAIVDVGVGASRSSDVVEVELALGGGDALASAGSNARGSPWRVEVNRHTGEARTTAFASVGVRRGYDADVDARRRRRALLEGGVDDGRRREETSRGDWPPSRSPWRRSSESRSAWRGAWWATRCGWCRPSRERGEGGERRVLVHETADEEY